MRQLIDSTQIDQWFVGTRRDAQEVLPHLIRLLVTATIDGTSLKSLRIPVGDEINRPGFDGVIEVTSGNRYVPNGISVWEMGTGDPAEKFARDYGNRTTNPGGLDISETTFVFVTPHAWPQMDQRLKDKLQEMKWKDIRVLDSVHLAAWLEVAPAVARWLARQIGVPVEGLKDVEIFKKELDAAYRFDIPPHLLIGGRVDALAALTRFLEQGPAEIEVEGESVEEAAGFVAATVLSMPSDKREWASSRTLFAERPDALDFVAQIPSAHFIVPLSTEARRRAKALQSGGLRLVIPTVRSAGTRARSDGMIRLGAIRRDACATAISQSGITEPQAQRIARECKGSLTAALWMTAQGPDVPLAWTEGRPATDLAPLLLAGQWMASSTNDTSIVEYLAGRSYGDVEQTLAVWQAPSGPLIRRSALWDWVAGDYAWKCLAPAFDQKILERFRAVLFKVFGIPEPKFELPPEQRWAASVYGKEHPYSADLRSGLIGSLVQMTLNDELVRGGGEGFVSNIVVTLLSGDVLPRKDAWQSLAQWLPDLAEAAPAAFLSAADSFISDREAVNNLFIEVGVFGSSLHVYLLWALERLTWNKALFTRCVLTLGDLVSVDPGGRLSNRPINSLSEIFLPWHPQGDADIPHRLAAVDVLFARHPEVAWRLAVALLPGKMGFASSIARPQWRDWNVAKEPAVTNYDYWNFVGEIVARMLKWAGNSGTHWQALIESYPRLLIDNPELANLTIESMRELRPEDFASEDRQQVNEALRTLIDHHREFRDEEWAMKPDRLQVFEEMRLRFLPQDPRQRHRWLFAWWPRLPEERELGYQELSGVIEKRREEAVREVFTSGGLDGILQFGEEAESPDAVGYAFSQVNDDSDVEAHLLDHALSVVATREGIPPLLRLGIRYVGGRFQRWGPQWIQRVRQYDSVSWDANRLANLAWGLPESGSTWDWVEAWSDEAAALYWSRVPLMVLQEPGRDTERALRSLLRAGRPYRAILLANMSMHNLKGKAETVHVRSELIIQALTEAAKQAPGDEWYSPNLTSLAHGVEELLTLLEERGVSEEEIAGIEWLWMAALEHGTRGTRALQNQLSSRPSLFIDALKLAFRADDEEPRELTEQERNMGTQAYRLLHQWKKVPGTQESHTPKEKLEGDVSFDTGRVEEGRLFEWIQEARGLAREHKRLGVCDSLLGNVLAHSPADLDGRWPCEPVRNLIESLKSETLDRGIQIGVYNKRGIHRRERGGEQERRLAKKFRGYAEQVFTRWPRTASILEQIAKAYDREAKQEDERAAFEEFE